MICSRLVSTTRPIRDLVHFADGFADHGERVVTDLAVGTKIIGPDEVRSEDEYFDEIQDVKVTKDMLDLSQAHRQSEDRDASNRTSSKISTKPP